MTFHGYVNGPVYLAIGTIATLSTMGLWFRDAVREGTFMGHHTTAVQKGLIVGFILFIVSELLLFLSIFWAFAHSALAPVVELGCAWPPTGIQPINPFELPLLNTVLLLSSGATVTWAHHSLIAGDRRGAIIGLISTLALGLIFTTVQGYEYYNAPFTIADGIFGSCFYVSTGAHGLHVLVGSMLLAVSLYRLINYHFTNRHHVGLECAILYWHFVDIIWLLLFILVYW
jgi:cytochrome c oxidase subunit 3